MKKIIAVFLIVIFATLLLPAAVVFIFGAVKKEQAPETDVQSGMIDVYFADEDAVRETDINEYIKCVVAAEMPADFEEEALKAQAVAARTYLYSHIAAKNSGTVYDSHQGAVICTNSAHCQAYISESKCKSNWGGSADANWAKISTAADETTGQIMTYNGEVISAVFHSTSSGETESAADVWGSDVPYLQSVESVGDELSPKFYSSLTVREDEFKATADEKLDGTDWSKGLFGNIVRSDAGGIITLDVGGVNIRGSELRSMFSLRSANVELSENDGNVTMQVKGFGHGVGMSQYGANYLASQGKTYEEILKTYYTDIEITTV